MPNEKPILFKPEMVRAILDGKKTQTRRVVNHIPALGGPERWCHIVKERPMPLQRSIGDYRAYCPYGVAGDRLWVREPIGHGIIEPNFMAYKADDVVVMQGDLSWPSLGEKKSIPSIHMPRWACRLVLEITDVRVERLQDITEDDILSEGVRLPPTILFPGTNTLWKLRQQMEKLWNSIHNKDGYDWDKSPWVWVLTFKRI